MFKCDRLQNEDSYCLNCSLQGTMNQLISLCSYTMAAIMMAFLITVIWSRQELLKGDFPPSLIPFHTPGIFDWEVASYPFSPTFSSAFLHLCHITLTNLEILIQLEKLVIDSLPISQAKNSKETHRHGCLQCSRTKHQGCRISCVVYKVCHYATFSINLFNRNLQT